MALTVTTNISSLVAQRNLGKTQMDLSDTINRLSSGLRINNAKDDAAGLAISETMRNAITGLRQANRNANDGISLVQTAEAALNEQITNLQRMKEIATQAANGTYSTSDLANLDAEFQNLDTEINRIASITDFNGISLLNNTNNIVIQVGDKNNANNQVTLTGVDTQSATLSINALQVDTQANAQAAMTALDTAIGTVTTGLAAFGADNSNLDAAIRNNGARADALESARSRIKDADFALESSNFAKFNVLQQAGVSMLAQANATTQSVLSLIG